MPFSNDDGLVINDETTRATFASDGGVSETEDLPVEMDVDASMEDAFPPEDRDGGAAGPADASTENLFGSGSAQARTGCARPRRHHPNEPTTRTRRVPRRVPSAGPGPVPEEDDARLAESTPPARASPERSVSPAERAAVGAEPEAESPTRLAAAAAPGAACRRDRAPARRGEGGQEGGASERVVAQRVLSHRKGIEEAEARASEMDDARADAQRFLERAGAHALAAAGAWARRCCVWS